MIQRIIEKLDEYLSKNDIASAERHLNYWYSDAESNKDMKTLFFITNELIGFYRKQGNKDKALYFCDKAEVMCESPDFSDTSAAATAFINIGTANKAFFMADKAIPFFAKAEKIYKNTIPCNDVRFAGLYNNMGLALMDLGNFGKAMELYDKAVDILKESEQNDLEIAITLLNKADVIDKEKGYSKAEKNIDLLVEKAWSLLEYKSFYNKGYYAFVCEKCASAFGYYGYFLYDRELRERAKIIYEGN